MDKDEFLYRSAKLISYPTWTGAFLIGILLVAGTVTGSGWIIAMLILLGIAMPIGVKLSRMELTKSILAVFQIGLLAERERVERLRKLEQERERQHH